MNTIHPSDRLLRILASLAALGVVEAVEIGKVDVVQNDTGNEVTSVTTSIAPGSTPNFVIESSNRGDWDVWFGTPSDNTLGVPISVARENGRDNSAGGSPAGLNYATVTLNPAGSSREGKYYLPLHSTGDSAVGSGTEVNLNTASIYFPFAEGWLAAAAYNSANNSDLDSIVTGTELWGNAIQLGTHLVHQSGGIHTLDLSSFGASSADGILLVNGAKNEDNYALSRANSDGTFTIFVKDNGSNGAGTENDPLAFAYVGTEQLGCHGLVAMGRVNSDGTTDVEAGDFTLTKQGTGTWHLTVDGQNDSTGGLIVSPCRGADEDNNIDNFVQYEWAGSHWVIQSRDLPENGLEDGATEGEDMFEFAFFAASGSDAAPDTALDSPAPGNYVIGQPIALAATSTASGGISELRFGADGAVILTDDAAPYEASYTPERLGRIRIDAVAEGNDGCLGGAQPVHIISTPPAGDGGLFFNGWDSHVTFGDASDLKLDTFAVECWFKPEAGGITAGTGSGGVSGIPLVTKGRGESDGSEVDCNYFLGFDPASGAVVADFEDINSGLNHPVTGTTSVNYGEWNHAAATWDGASLKIYLNGSLEGEVASEFGPRHDSIQHAGIGTTFNSLGEPAGAFLGSIDEVRIWDTARSDIEIQESLNFELDGSESGLVGRWGFAEGSGESVASTAGSTIDGTLVSEPAWVEGATFSGTIPPMISITSPAAGLIEVNTVSAIEVDATDSDGSVVSVEFFVNGESIGTDTSAPYRANWIRPTLGDYQLTAIATDDSGEMTTSAPVDVTVSVFPPPTYVSFQDGVDGYDNTFDIALGKLFSDGTTSRTLGSEVNELWYDGNNGTDSPDLGGVIRFDEIIGDAASQIPAGATVLRANLIITTATASGSADSPGPWAVDRVLPEYTIDETTEYDDLDTEIDGFRGLRGVSSVFAGELANGGGFGAIDDGEVVSTDVTRIVQTWVEGTTNQGFSIFDAFTSNGWQICTTGNQDPNKRPKLEVWFTTEELDTYVVETSQSLRSDTTGANTDGSTIIDSMFLDMSGEDKQEALLGFDSLFGDGEGQVPANAKVHQAFLLITTNVVSNAQSGGPYSIHRITTPWDVSTDFGTTGLEIGTSVGESLGELYGMGQQTVSYFDITRSVLDIQGGGDNHGFALIPGTTDGWSPFWPGSELGTMVTPKIVVFATEGSEPEAGFEAWALDYGIPTHEEHDGDNDGIPALVEYALGFLPDQREDLPQLVDTGDAFTLSFAKGAVAALDSAIQYEIHVSPDLSEGSWTPAETVADDSSSIMATIPKGDPRGFARLVIIRE